MKHERYSGISCSLTQHLDTFRPQFPAAQLMVSGASRHTPIWCYGLFPLSQGHTIHVWDGDILLPLMMILVSAAQRLVICTGGGLILFSYVQILFIYDCCITMLLEVWHVTSSILTCWSPGFESSVKATVGRLKNIQIDMVFCTYTTTTLQFRFYHCCFIIRMHVLSFWAKGKFMVMFNYHVSTHLQRYS